jgi:FkbM family methyltransferase
MSRDVLRGRVRNFPLAGVFRTHSGRIAVGMVLRHLLKLLPLSCSAALLRNRGGWARYYPTGRTLVFSHYLTDLTVRIDTDYPIEREMLSGVYDPPTLAVMQRFVRAGDTCIDVGANVGAITLALAQHVGPTGRVFSFEPGPELFRKLEHNLTLNPILQKRITALNQGLSDKEGNLLWIEDSGNLGNAGCMGVTSGEPVPGTTVDAFCRRQPLPALHFVKIDVEGMEYEVIRGGLATWAKYRPILYFETLKGFEEMRGLPLFARIETMLKEIGYSLYRVQADGTVCKTHYPDLSSNTMAIADRSERAP